MANLLGNTLNLNGLNLGSPNLSQVTNAAKGASSTGTNFQYAPYVAPKPNYTNTTGGYKIVSVNGAPTSGGSGSTGGVGTGSAAQSAQVAADPLAGYQDILNGLNQNTNDYYNQQQGFYQKGHDITQTNLNTQNTNLLGTQDQAARDGFLNGIYDPQMKQQGSLQYGYNLNLGHNNNVYDINSTTNRQNRDLALSKLATDEQNSLNDLALKQGQTNEATLEDLNSRGLTYGQSPTGGYQASPMGGMGGVAGQQAGLVNTDFANQRNEIVDPYNYNVQGTNQDYQNTQNMYDENHAYDNKNLAMGTVNDVNNQNANYALQSGTNNNQLEMYKAQLNNQKQAQLQDNFNTATKQAALKNGYATLT